MKVNACASAEASPGKLFNYCAVVVKTKLLGWIAAPPHPKAFTFIDSFLFICLFIYI